MQCFIARNLEIFVFNLSGSPKMSRGFATLFTVTSNDRTHGAINSKHDTAAQAGSVMH